MRASQIPFVLLLVVPFAKPLAAQALDSLQPGARIRVERLAAGRTDRITGTVLRLDSVGVAIADADGVVHSVARPSLISVDLSQGRRADPLRGAITGLVTGGGVLLITALYSARADESWELECGTGCVAGTLGVSVGAGVLGAFLDPREQWTSVPLAPASAQPEPSPVSIGYDVKSRSAVAGVRLAF